MNESISLHIVVVLFVSLVHFAPFVNSSEEGARAEKLQRDFTPKSVTFSRARLSLSSALTDIRNQTGMRLLDHRGVQHDPELSLDIKPQSFWQAVDAVARSA